MAQVQTEKTTTGRDAKGRFGPGNKGGGRPVLPPELKAMCQGKAAEAIQVAVNLLNDSEQPGNVRLKAAEIILDRGYGKATQPLEHDFKQLTDADLINRAKGIIGGAGAQGTDNS